MWNPAGDDGGLGDDGDDGGLGDDGDDGGDDQKRLESGAKESSQVDLDSATVLALISAAAFVISRQIDI